jgi:N4-gp56 family major capsid protein
MATSIFPAQGGTMDNTSQATFIPEIWSDEIVAAYKQNLVMANLVSKMPMVGKKGDTIHVPKPTRGAAIAKSEGVAVTLQNALEGEVVIDINRHFEYSRFIEDITTKQALNSMRAFYTGDAGYALAKQVEADLHSLATGLGDGGAIDLTPVEGDWTHSATFYSDASTGLELYAANTVAAADVITDESFRALVQKLDDADVPMDNRSFVVPPSVRNELLGIDRYVSSDFVGGSGVQTGMIGELYGIKIFVSTACPVLVEAANNSAGGDIRVATIFHKDTFVHAEQAGVRAQTQYKQEFLSDLFTSDTIYGVQTMRPDAGFNLAVNS